MLLSREKAAIPQSPGQFGRSDKPEEMEVPTIESFFKNRDYKGALTLIDFEARINVSLIFCGLGELQVDVQSPWK